MEYYEISILAVLADRDAGDSISKTVEPDFNPRGPCGPLPSIACSVFVDRFAFQSSRSLRTATR